VALVRELQLRYAAPLADPLKMDVDHIQNVITNLDGLAKGADSVLGTADKFINTTETASGTIETTARYSSQSESGHHVR
jgi:hypothetical protein